MRIGRRGACDGGRGSPGVFLTAEVRRVFSRRDAENCVIFLAEIQRRGAVFFLFSRKDAKNAKAEQDAFVERVIAEKNNEAI